MLLGPDEVDSRIPKARKILRQGLEEKSALIKEFNTIPFVYGSVQYGDPRNLDLDLFLFVDKEITFEEGLEFRNELTEYFIGV